MLITFRGFPHTDTYCGCLAGADTRWASGESREVPSATGEYLLATFPKAFEVVSTPAPKGKDRAVKSPPKRKAPAKKKAAKKVVK